MIPAATAHSTRHPWKCRAGFTLIEVIVAMVVTGILASIAGMGIVSAINGFVMIRENVALAQKIQLTATRINRELLELTEIDYRDDTPPYIVYESATGERRAIAKVNDTIRLYADPEKTISSSYLENK